MFIGISVDEAAICALIVDLEDVWGRFLYCMHQFLEELGSVTTSVAKHLLKAAKARRA